MGRKYAVLQKKLEELESILTKVFADPLETSLPYRRLLSEAIKGKILFLRNLLSAETDSHQHHPQHLDHIAQRLERLETAFHDWDEARSFPLDFPRTLRPCSCTSSCLNDSQDKETLDPCSPLHNADPDSIFPFNFMDETSRTQETVEETLVPPKVAMVNKEEKREEGWRFAVGKRNRIMSIVAALGMVVGVATAGFIKGSFYQSECVSLIPT